MIVEHTADPKARTFAERLIDAEEDKYVRAAPVGRLWQREQACQLSGSGHDPPTPFPAARLGYEIGGADDSA